MKTSARISIAVFVLFAASTSHTARAQAAAKATGAEASLVERGRYLVEDVVQCARCHTPNNQAGEAGHAKWLMGGPLQIQPTYPVSDWAVIVPRIARRPPGTDNDFIRLMTTGITRTGAPPRPPMLRPHMTRADAEAILAYLKTL
ncbi:MAG TPA: cytochrome c [Bryobacteraceae bacterium]|nr:cytochrome c [Bryobacteraceae bacterium]